MFRRYLLTGLVAGFLSISSTLYPVKLTDTRGVKEYVEAFLFNGVYAGESEIILKDNTTASGLTVKEETANTAIARFRGDGNVGIGTTNPLARLQVNAATGDAELRLLGSAATAANAAYVSFYNSAATRIGYAGDYGSGDDNIGIVADGSRDIILWAGGVEALRAKAGGNVGIGTTRPTRKLEVVGDTATSADFAFVGAGNHGLLDSTAGAYYISKAGTLLQVGAGGVFTDGIQIFPGSANSVRILNNGNVGIGTTAPSEKLEVSGNIKASGTVSQGSSRELKKNISYISTKEAMKALNGLKPVRFEYKADNFGEEHLGFIAEDVPELVAEQDRKHLNPMDLTAVFAKVIQEQQKMLQDQKETIDAMKREMEMMKSAMNYGVKGL